MQRSAVQGLAVDRGLRWQCDNYRRNSHCYRRKRWCRDRQQGQGLGDGNAQLMQQSLPREMVVQDRRWIKERRGSVTIDGGTVIATGGSGGAGIGGGSMDRWNGNIIIKSHPAVFAIGRDGGADIGNGANGVGVVSWRQYGGRI